MSLRFYHRIARNLIFLQFLYFWNFSTDWWNENFRTSSNHVDYFQHQVLWLRKHEKPTIVKIKCLDWRSIKNHTRDEPFGCSQCDFEFLKIKCSYWRSMKKPTLGMNPLAAPSVTSSFQNQVLWLKKHEKTHTRDEPFGCSQCDFKFSTSSAVIEEAWKNPHFSMNPSAAPSVTSSFKHQVLWLNGMKNTH